MSCVLIFRVLIHKATWAAGESNLSSSNLKTHESRRKTACLLSESSFWMIASMFLKWRWHNSALIKVCAIWEWFKDRFKVIFFTFSKSMQDNPIIASYFMPYVLRGIYCIFWAGRWTISPASVCVCVCVSFWWVV